MAREQISRGRAGALIGLAVFVELVAAFGLILGGDAVSRRGIPLWLLGLLLVPFGIWLA